MSGDLPPLTGNWLTGYHFPCITPVQPGVSEASPETPPVSWRHMAGPPLPAWFGNTGTTHPGSLRPTSTSEQLELVSEQ